MSSTREEAGAVLWDVSGPRSFLGKASLGDPPREVQNPDFEGGFWTRERLEWASRKINRVAPHSVIVFGPNHGAF
jgi:hypothetical protein